MALSDSTGDAYRAHGGLVEAEAQRGSSPVSSLLPRSPVATDESSGSRPTSAPQVLGRSPEAAPFETGGLEVSQTCL